MALDLEPILQGILSAASSAMNEAGRTPGRVELTPGALPAWDDCCEGQLYLRIIEVYPTMGKNSPFPQIDAAQVGAAGGQCSIHMLAVHIALGILRCAATVDSNGKSPTPAQVTTDAGLMMDDMSTLLDVLVCDSQTVAGVKSLKMDRWTPTPNEGGCVGGEWGAYIAVDPCLCQQVAE